MIILEHKKNKLKTQNVLQNTLYVIYYHKNRYTLLELSINIKIYYIYCFAYFLTPMLMYN